MPKRSFLERPTVSDDEIHVEEEVYAQAAEEQEVGC